MSRKNDRNRQKRLQRKRNKRAANRASRRPAGGLYGELPDSEFDAQFHSPEAIAELTCLGACEALLSGCGGLDGVREKILLAAGIAGGIWRRLLLELEKFLYEGTPWSLTCAALEPVRSVFEQYDYDRAFSRLWTLALTNEPGTSAFSAEEDQDCPHRAALAFQELRRCLDEPGRSPAVALREIALEIQRHSDTGTNLDGSYQALLKTALASLRTAPTERGHTLAEFALKCQKVFDRYSREQSSHAWWECGRLFLAEVLERHVASGSVGEVTAYPDLITQLFGAADAAVFAAQWGGTGDPLRSIHVQTKADAWLHFLKQRIDPLTLAFEDRVRYDIAHLKLLRARARQRMLGSTGSGEPREFLAAFDTLHAFLAHGVPPTSRALPGILESPLLDFYVDAVQELHCEDVALRGTEALLHRHPEDFRLACLYATGAVMRREHHKLTALKGHLPRARIDTDLFARCATIWAHLPQGAKAGATLRTLLFDPLDRDHRKQCLMNLAQQVLRRAATVSGYTEELRCLLPYFEHDNFIYRELREKAALESGLVFLATMMAPLHNIKLTLTESQSQQWVSHAREIAQQSPVGSKLAIHYLKAPSRWFTLTPDVRNAARSRIDDFQPPSRPRTIEPARPKRARRKRRGRIPGSQPGLFDALDP